MFGRQTERERVLDFLLHPAATPILAVLPIVGPTTLVEHVCRDENVRSRFSTILFFPEGSLEDEGVTDLRGGSNFKVRHQNHATQSHTRFLIIVETAKDINEGAWRSLKSCVTRMAPCGGSKIIVTAHRSVSQNSGSWNDGSAFTGPCPSRSLLVSLQVARVRKREP